MGLYFMLGRFCLRNRTLFIVVRLKNGNRTPAYITFFLFLASANELLMQ